jgi:hypothetical protein
VKRVRVMGVRVGRVSDGRVMGVRVMEWQSKSDGRVRVGRTQHVTKPELVLGAI